MENLDLEFILQKARDGQNIKIAMIGAGIGAGYIEKAEIDIATQALGAIMVMPPDFEHEYELAIIASLQNQDTIIHSLSKSLPSCEIVKVDDMRILKKIHLIIQKEMLEWPIIPEIVVKLSNTLMLDDTPLVTEMFKSRHDKRDRHKPKCNARGNNKIQASRKSFNSRRRG